MAEENTALTELFSQPRRKLFTVRYKLKCIV